MARLVAGSRLRSPMERIGNPGRALLRAGDCRLVAVPQPRALVRAVGSARCDGRRRGRDLTPRSRVDFERDDGFHAVRLRHPRAEPRTRRMGRGRPRPFQRPPTSVDGRRRSTRMRTVDGHPDRRPHRRRRFGSRMALDADARATAPGTRRQRTPRRCSRHAPRLRSGQAGSASRCSGGCSGGRTAARERTRPTCSRAGGSESGGGRPRDRGETDFTRRVARLSRARARQRRSRRADRN
jgi:hypothetical protein